MKRLLPCLLGVSFVVSSFDHATGGVIMYDASSGLLPQSVGWGFVDENNPSSTVSVSGGTLTLDSAVLNRANWEIADLVGVGILSGSQSGAFMEATVRVVSESHTSANRGLLLFDISDTNGVLENHVDLYGWEDRVFVNDSTDTTVATVLMDTTDQFHTYRLELIEADWSLFVDGSLATTGTSPQAATGVLEAGFGDGSAFSGSVSEWTTVTVGSIPVADAPAVPEPCGLVLFATSAVCLLGFARRRHLRTSKRVVRTN